MKHGWLTREVFLSMRAAAAERLLEWGEFCNIDRKMPKYAKLATPGGRGFVFSSDRAERTNVAMLAIRKTEPVIYYTCARYYTDQRTIRQIAGYFEVSDMTVRRRLDKGKDLLARELWIKTDV